MRKYYNQLLFSASDLMRFLGCRYAISLDLIALDEPLERTEDDPQAQLVQQKGLEHEHNYLQSLRDEGYSIVEIPDAGALQKRAEETKQAMKDGAEVIYQGVLLHEPWHGYADFFATVPPAVILRSIQL